MRTLLFAAMVLTSTASAQVIECPRQFSSKDVPLPADSLGHKGSARLLPARLSFAYMYFGELYGQQDLVGPASRTVMGGWNTEYDFRPQDTNWLVCRYGGNEWSRSAQVVGGPVEWWVRLDPEITSCVLKIREVKKRNSPIYWTATASCK